MYQRLITFSKEHKRLQNAVLIVNDDFNVEISFWYDIQDGEDEWVFERFTIEFSNYGLATSYVEEVSGETILEYCKTLL